MDIKKAFDSTWWPSIFHSLVINNCLLDIFYLIKAYLSNRKVSFSHGTFTSTRPLIRGCPQGSIISPIL